MNSNKTLQGHTAILTANIIFGLGVPVTKFLLDEWVTPMTYMASRCIGATIIFWLISLFLPKEKVEKRDLIVIMAGGLLLHRTDTSVRSHATMRLRPVSPATTSLTMRITGRGRPFRCGGSVRCVRGNGSRRRGRSS